MGEIIFEKSRKNLKKIYNRINSDYMGRVVGDEEVLFLAIGGYNRTHDLLLAMGLDKSDIATYSKLDLVPDFLKETHNKKVLYIKKINYVTSVNKSFSFTKKMLDLNVADSFQESMMIYETAERQVGAGKGKPLQRWIKPTIVVLDDSSLNLQYDGHRFRYATDIGFVQIRNKNVSPHKIIAEIQEVDEAERMMFALYQFNEADETAVLDALNELQKSVQREVDGEWYLKPTEFKKIVGSNELATQLKEIKELSIRQLKSNKKIGKENARWIIIPESAFEFKGYDYQDEDEMFEEELRQEELSEQEQEAKQEKMLESIMLEEFTLNFMYGYKGNEMESSQNETLHSFVREVDDFEENLQSVPLLEGATTEDEYKHIKAHNLMYFLDGDYQNNIRNNKSYLGGKILLSLDIDDGELTREQVESKLESQGYFGLVYPTAKRYFNNSKRWRIIMVADEEMDEVSYRNVIRGVSKMLDIEIDNASEKISQLMGAPFKRDDISTVIGTKVNVKQFNKKVDNKKVVDIERNFETSKSIMDFNHPQARLLKECLTNGFVEGERNNKYFEVIRYLRDTAKNPEFKKQHQEAIKLEQLVVEQMYSDGLSNKEVELLTREV